MIIAADPNEDLCRGEFYKTNRFEVIKVIPRADFVLPTVYT